MTVWVMMGKLNLYTNGSDVYNITNGSNHGTWFVKYDFIDRFRVLYHRLNY